MQDADSAGRRLSAVQAAAIDHVRGLARGGRDRALRRIGQVAAAPLIENVRGHGRVTLNFHPDRILPTGVTVAESLGADGRYRSQFETQISSGGLSAFPGGDRDRWEERLFGSAYHVAGVRNGERPKYGALNLM